MKYRRTLQGEILNALRSGPIVSICRFLFDAGCYDYSYGLRVFRDLERQGRITMTLRPDLRGRPWEIRKGPAFAAPQIGEQLPLGERELWNLKTSLS